MRIRKSVDWTQRCLLQADNLLKLSSDTLHQIRGIKNKCVQQEPRGFITCLQTSHKRETSKSVKLYHWEKRWEAEYWHLNSQAESRHLSALTEKHWSQESYFSPVKFSEHESQQVTFRRGCILFTSSITPSYWGLQHFHIWISFLFAINLS